MGAPSGVVVPMVTPVRDGDVDVEAIAEFVTGLVEGNGDGLFPCGTLGEFSSFGPRSYYRIYKN
jgi:4-hydroxy-tetrahydrodipicolinate synthase